MSTTQDINMREMVHFPCLSQGDTHLRSRGWPTFLYDNGAFRIFNGVMPESVVRRCREYAEIVDGCLRWLGKRPVPSEEAEIIAALDSVFRAINNESPNDSPVERADSGLCVDENPLGIKRMRTWMSPPAGDCANLPTTLDGEKIFYAVAEHSPDMRRIENPGGERLKFWGAQEAVNCQSMINQLMAKVGPTEIMGR